MSTDLSGKFVSQVLQQLIFRSYVDLSNHKEPVEFPHQRLVCRNNSELYLANKNYVRCSTLGSKSSFKLLDLGLSFKIESLLLNSLSSALAIVGKKEISIALLPNNLALVNKEVQVKSYNIGNIKGNVVKCLWHTAISKDTLLVVLTDELFIQVYDISNSTSVPTLSIDLKEYSQFKDVESATISFGSQKNLIGSLTLYVGTSTSRIYAFYPFIPENATLATTNQDVEEALQESISILRTAENKFPYSTLLETANSYLKKRAVAQFEYVSSIKKQITNVVPKEVRGVSGEPYELILLEQVSAGLPALQGPLFEADNTLMDIHYNYSNPKFTSLVSVACSEDETFIRHHAQLKPLLMEWNHQTSEVVEIPDVKVTKKHGYAKPKRGFGFVNLSDEDDEEEDKQEQVLTQKRDRTVAESKFLREELLELTTIGVDSLPLSSKGYVRPIQDTKLFIHLDDKIIVGDIGKWALELERNIELGNLNSPLDFNSTYQLITSNAHELTGITLLTDADTGTGDYLVSCSSKSTENVVVTQIGAKTKPEAKETLSEERIEDFKIDYKEPIEEILHDLEPISNIDKALRNAIQTPSVKIKGDIDSLKAVNTISNLTANSASKLTSLSLRMYSRVFTQVDEMQTSIKKLEEVHNQVLSKEDYEETQERINKVIKRQAKLDSRLNDLENKLQDTLIKAKEAKTLPLSLAEKEWFREINSMSSELSKSPDSLAAKTEKLTLQASALVKALKDGLQTEDRLKQLEINLKVSKLLYHLEEEKAIIQAAKVQLENSFLELKI